MSFLSNASLKSLGAGDSRRLGEDPSWLQPWRVPEDAHSGGVALYSSVENLLNNVVKARKTSVNLIYGLRHNPETATLMTSMRSIEAQQHTPTTGVTLLDIACSPTSRRTSTVFEPRSSTQFSLGMHSHSDRSSEAHDSARYSTKGTSESPEPVGNTPLVADAEPGSSPVPVIPRFSKLLEEKEKLMKYMEKDPIPHPRGSSGTTSERPRDSEFSPLRYDSVEPLSHTARPRGDSDSRPPSSIISYGSSADHHSDAPSPSPSEAPLDENQEGEEEEYEEFDSDNNGSEQNFGEGGHLACVPGDSLSNRYTLIRQLGVGRSSRVWLAVDQDQCAVSRRQLIRELGEEEVRKLYNPKDKPLFVAIKVFRCGETYSDCALYESSVLKYINEYIRVKSIQRRFTIGSHRASRGRLTDTLTRVSRADSRNSAIEDVSVNTITSVDPQLEAVLAYHERITCMKGFFSVDGEYGTHHCLVMDVVGAGVDTAINEAELKGLPLEIVSSILHSALEGLALLASLNVIHTDIKPENLLFVDLEESIAMEMGTMQTSLLKTDPDSDLWGPSAGRRQSVADYIRARQSGTPPANEERLLNLNHYKVYVSDFGLSFVIPPVLRSGVKGFQELGVDDDVFDLDPMEQVELMAKAREVLIRKEKEARLHPIDSNRSGSGSPQHDSSPPFKSITATPSGIDSTSAVRVERVSYLDVRRLSSDSIHHDREPASRFSQRNVAYTSGQPGSPLPGTVDLAENPLPHLTREESPHTAPAMSSLYSAVVAPPTALEKDILTRQNYKRGITVQSREYRSPEIILGQHFLPSSDIWSLGCIAYELVVGKFLFDVHADYDEEVAVVAEAMQKAQQKKKESSGQFSKWVDRFNLSRSTSGAVYEDEKEPVVEALYYEEYEKDLDVVHLKAIMKVIGPPPLTHLLDTPGLFVEHFFDKDGNFLFYEGDDMVMCGVDHASSFMQQDLLALSRQGGPADSSVSSSPSVSWLQDTHTSATPFLISPISQPLSPHTAGMPSSTFNYPIQTPRWKEIQRELEEKMGSKEEAREFEAFLLACIQWDPSKRQDALSLLHSDWLLSRQ